VTRTMTQFLEISTNVAQLVDEFGENVASHVAGSLLSHVINHSSALEGFRFSKVA
jgi:hypothetical protein